VFRVLFGGLPRENVGELLGDRGQPCNGLAVVERNTLMLNPTQLVKCALGREVGFISGAIGFASPDLDRQLRDSETLFNIGQQLVTFDDLLHQ